MAPEIRPIADSKSARKLQRISYKGIGVKDSSFVQQLYWCLQRVLASALSGELASDLYSSNILHLSEHMSEGAPLIPMKRVSTAM